MLPFIDANILKMDILSPEPKNKRAEKKLSNIPEISSNRQF